MSQTFFFSPIRYFCFITSSLYQAVCRNYILFIVDSADQRHVLAYVFITARLPLWGRPGDGIFRSQIRGLLDLALLLAKEKVTIGLTFFRAGSITQLVPGNPLQNPLFRIGLSKNLRCTRFDWLMLISLICDHFVSQDLVGLGKTCRMLHAEFFCQLSIGLYTFLLFLLHLD